MQSKLRNFSHPLFSWGEGDLSEVCCGSFLCFLLTSLHPCCKIKAPPALLLFRQITYLLAFANPSPSTREEGGTAAAQTPVASDCHGSAAIAGKKKTCFCVVFLPCPLSLRHLLCKGGFVNEANGGVYDNLPFTISGLFCLGTAKI